MSHDSHPMQAAPCVTLVCSTFLVLAAAACQPRHVAAQGTEYVKAHYTKYEYRIPMRDGKRLFTAVYVPKDRVAALPDPAVRARPTACGPTASISTSPTSALRRCSARRATSSSTRTCAAAGCRRASSSTCGRTSRVKNGPQDIDESTDTYDTIDWLIKHVPNHNGKVGHVGHLVSRLLHGGRHDRRPSRAQGGLAAGADHRLVHRRRLAPQRRLFLPHMLQLHGHLRPSAAASRPRSSSRPSITRRPTATSSSCDLGPLSNVNAQVLQGRRAVLERGDAARHLRRLLEGDATSGRTSRTSSRP